MTEIYDLKREQQDIKDELLDQHQVFATLDREREESKRLEDYTFHIQQSDKSVNNNDDDDDDDDNDNIDRNLPDVPVLAPGINEITPPKSILKKKRNVSIQDTVSTKYYDLRSEERNYKASDPEDDTSEEDDANYLVHPY